jgi:hypothetical protein
VADPLIFGRVGFRTSLKHKRRSRPLPFAAPNSRSTPKIRHSLTFPLLPNYPALPFPMVAPVPAQISNPIPSTGPVAPPLTTTHHPLPTSPRMLTSFLLITYIQTKYFHTLAHSFAQRRAAIPCPSKSLRTLSIATGVCLEGVPDDGPSGVQHANPFVCIGLLPLCPLFSLFSAFVSFVFNRLQPLFRKHPGGGICAPSSSQRKAPASDLQELPAWNGGQRR